ncbi:MAG: hypothetical protein Q8936_14250 [Bacillota bacterium]|nr:hypothetical protein [Bacillota bacterium]
MAGIKISALPAVASALTTDFFPVVQGGVTSKETLTQVGTLFGFTAGVLGVTHGGTGLSSTTINQILYSSAANTIAGLPTAASSVLITSAGGVPSLNSVLPGGLTTTDPTLAQGIATKNYVDTIATGGGAPVVAASTAPLTVTYSNGSSGIGATLTNAGAFAAFALDGQSPTVGQRVLIKDQASTLQNGVYTVTTVGDGVSVNWVLTRATDYDTPTNINDTGIIPVSAGTVNANTGWINTTLMVTVGATAVTFVQFGVSFPVSIANGGTGATTAAGARSNLSAAILGSNNDITGMSALTSVTTASLITFSGNGGTAFTGNNIFLGSNGLGATVAALWFAPTLNKGYVAWQASDNSGNFQVLFTNASMGQNTTITFPDPGAATATVAYSKTSTFTPVLAFGGASTGITYVTQTGEYTQIGNIVYITVNIALSSKGSSTGTATISGFPIASAGGSFPLAAMANLTQINSFISFDAGTTFPLKYNTANGGINVLADTHFANNTQISVNGFYFTS